jgi:iron complex outermembrane recepter protein
MSNSAKSPNEPYLHRSLIQGTVSAILRRGGLLPRLASTGGLLLGAISVHAQTAPVVVQGPDAPLQEVIVTAQRRNETVQDIPYNISVVSAASIQQSGATGLNDLTRLVAGLTTVDEGPGARGQTNNLTLRGLRTNSPGGGNATTETPGQSVNSVSTYFGETPVFFPMPLYDVERVEVLRGPQGTLYGSGAEAGTIRLIPTRPQFDKFSGEVQAMGSATEDSISWGNLNSGLRGIVNVPLATNLALRVVAGGERYGGFIDNNNLVVREGETEYAVPIPSIPGDLTSGPVIAPLQRETNTSHQWFARAALRWQPVEAVDLQMDYLHQYIKADNTQYANPGYAGGRFDFTSPDASQPPGPANPAFYPNSSFTMNPGGRYTSSAFVTSPYDDTTNLYSLVGSVDLGFATFTSATSYYTDDSIGVSDWTGLIDNVPPGINYTPYFPYNNYPRIVTPAYVPASDHAFIQEVRLVSKGVNRLDYVVGLYYQDLPANAGWSQLMPGITAYDTYIGQPNPTKQGDLVWLYQRTSEFKDKAAFGELTLHITPAWQVTGGVRYFKQDFKADVTTHLYLCGAACSSDGTDPTGLSVASSSSDFSKHVWKANSSYDFGPNTKVYVTYSEGFRRGGANGVPTAGNYASLPVYLTYMPDLAKNYEVGIKGSLMEGRMRYVLDAYRVNLENFQFDSVNLSGLPMTYNGSEARSQGIELDLQFAFSRDTSASLGYAYTNAEVRKTFTLYDYPPYATIPGGSGETAPLFGGPIVAGSKLPGVPENTLTFGIDHTLHPSMLGSSSLTLHADGAYRDTETANIKADSPYNWTIPSSFIGNLRATVATGEHFSYSLFVENFTNDAGYSGSTNVQNIPNYGRFRFVARPRTYGLNLRFGW